MITSEKSLQRPAICSVSMASLATVLLLARSGGAAAFPLVDPSEPEVPAGTELPAADVQDLRHQLQLVNGLSAPLGGGWTIIPRIGLEEAFTDNVLQVHTPRRFDLVTLVSPGIAVAGDLPRLRLTFDYAPILSLYARNGDLNSLTQQMSGLGSVTLAPDLAFVDVRAVSGVNSIYGGVGGQGTVGASGAATTPQATSTAYGYGQGLNKDSELQTSSFGISPYVQQRFGDWGTGRLGASLDVTESHSLSGFAAPPFPTGGSNAQTLLTTEQTAHFVSGDKLQFVQDAFDVDLRQSQTTTGSGVVDQQTGTVQPGTLNSSSTRALISDQITYQFNRNIALFVSGGHEDIHYSNGAGIIGAPSIDDLTWSFGTTLTPDPDSSITVSYGHLNGFNSLTVNGHYALTARTQVMVSYGSTLGTQLETVQNQLNLATVSRDGTLVNGQTGGQLFGSTNALAVQQGVFRTTTLAVGTQTSLDRDIISLNLLLAKQTSMSGVSANDSSSRTASVTWLHQLHPDMITSASLSYAIQEQTAGTGFANLGNSSSIAASLAWQWQLSDTLSASLRYSFFERQSDNINFNTYQNLIILGITKTF